MIFVWGDGSFAEYWVRMPHQLEEAALLATAPQNSGVLSDELLDQIYLAIRRARQENLLEEPDNADCFCIDCDSTHYRLAGAEYQEADCPDQSGPLAVAKEVANAILARDGARPKHAVYQVFDRAREALRDGGGLVVGEVVVVATDAQGIGVEVAVTSVVVGRAIPGSTVVFDSAVAAVTESEATAVSGLPSGAPVWVVVDANGSGLYLAALDESGRLVDWGPSTSPFSLGHAAFLAAANQAEIGIRRVRCAAHPDYDSPHTTAGDPGNTLATALQLWRVLDIDDVVSQANRPPRFEEETPLTAAGAVTFEGGDKSLAYVIVGDSGRHVDWFAGSASLDSRPARLMAAAGEESLTVYSIDLSISGCRPGGGVRRVTFVAMAFGELITKLPVDRLTLGGRTQIDLTTGEISTES